MQYVFLVPRGRRRPPDPPTLRPKTYAILLRVEAEASRPVLVREDDKLPPEKGALWRYVARTDGHAETLRLAEVLEQRCVADEPWVGPPATASASSPGRRPR